MNIGVYCLTVAAQFALQPARLPRPASERLPSRRQPTQQLGQSKQVHHPKCRASGCERHERIWLHHVRPRRGDAPEPPVLVVEAHPAFSPGLVPSEEFELPAALRVERMRYADNPRRSLPILRS